MLKFLSVLLLVSAAAALQGDNDFAQAIDVSFLASRSEFSTMLSERNFTASLTQDCIDSSFASSKGQMASFAYPKLSDSSSNTLRKIYDSKVMKVGITVYNSFIDIMTKGMEKVAYKIGEFYLGGAIGLPVKAEYYYYSDEYVMINDLLSGKLDILAPTMNRVLTFGGHMRLERIKETCSLFSMQMNFYTIDATLNSIDEIIQHAISRGEYILVQTYEQGLLLQTLFGVKTDVRDGLNPSMLTGNATVAAMLSFNDYKYQTSLPLRSSQFIVPIKAFVRQELNYVPIENSNEPERSMYLGNNYLRDFLDYEIGSVIQSEKFLINSKPTSEYIVNADCAPATLGVPSSLEGVSSDVIKTGKIVIGYYPIHASPMLDTDTLNDRNFLDTNYICKLENTVINNFYSRYGKLADIQRVIFSSYDEMLTALDTGVISASTAMTYLGSSVDNGSYPLRWKYDFSCSAASWSLSFYLKQDVYAQVANFSDFKNLVATKLASYYSKKTALPKILVTDTITLSLLVPTFGDVTYNITEVVKTSSEAWTKLFSIETQQVQYIAFVPPFPPQSIPSGVSKLPSPIFVNTGMAFRKNRRYLVSGYSGPDPEYPASLFGVISYLTNLKLAWYFILLIVLAAIALLSLVVLAIVSLVKCIKRRKYRKLKEDDPDPSSMKELDSKKGQDYTPPSISF
eukprot:TRINITY_DN1418_c0_g1_i1.p1 TRINITY_DN1418_c0_g1~~TRINITY_DN1418_c0_g1_i1.p1  ORF type:complete len:682 (+),score=173.41 TRINITY_DN1418_c0_g1_i1:2-2047(+)